MKVLLFGISLFILMGCNRALLVNRDNVIVKQKGYLVIVSNNEIQFLCARIDTSLSIEQNLLANKLLRGHNINYLPLTYVQSLTKYSDTRLPPFNSKLIPVVYEYRHIKERNKQLRKENMKWYKYWFDIKGKQVDYMIRRGYDYQFVNIKPYVSVRKQISLVDTTQ